MQGWHNAYKHNESKLYDIASSESEQVRRKFPPTSTNAESERKGADSDAFSETSRLCCRTYGDDQNRCRCQSTNMPRRMNWAARIPVAHVHLPVIVFSKNLPRQGTLDVVVPNLSNMVGKFSSRSEL